MRTEPLVSTISTSIAAAAATATLLLACGGGDDGDALRGRGPAAGGDMPAAPEAPPAAEAPALCKGGREYVGYAATKLEQTRLAGKVGDNRARMKPFGALKTEFTRVLGSEPASLATADATFASAPPRWYAEPAANAVALKTAYDIAFDGCLTYVAADSKLAQAPTAASATDACGAMARTFWSKTPAPKEIQACVDVATTGAASEPDVTKKWAYACASVLTSAGFLTY